MRNYIYYALAILTVLATTFNCNAQSMADISVSKPYKNEATRQNYYYHDGNNIIKVMHDVRFYRIQTYGIDPLAFSAENNYEIKTNDSIIGSFETKSNKIFVVGRIKKGHTSQFYARQVHVEDASLGEKIDLFTEEKELSSGGYIQDYSPGIICSNAYHNKVKAMILTSPDKSRIAIHYIVGASDNHNGTSIWVMYDENLNELWNMRIDLPYSTTGYSTKYFEGFKYHLSNNGDIYVLTKVTTQKVKTYKGLMQGHVASDKHARYELAFIDHESQAESRVEIQASFHAISGMTLVTGNKGNVYMAGAYNSSATIKEAASAQGLFLTPVTGGEFGEYQNFEIPPSVRKSYMKKKDVRQNVSDNGTALKYLSIRNIDFDKAGGFIISAEVNYSDGNNFSFAKGIIVMSVDAGGSVEWAKEIPKNQTNRQSYDVGFYYMASNAYSYYVFPDKDKNLGDIPKDKEPKKMQIYGSASFVVYKVDKNDGSMTKGKLFDIKDFQGHYLHNFSFKNIVRLNDTEFATEFYLGHDQEIMMDVHLK